MVWLLEGMFLIMSFTLLVLVAIASAHFLHCHLFLIWTILKLLLDSLQYCFCLMFWFNGCETWDFTSPTRDWTYTPCIRRLSPNHWTTREVSPLSLLSSSSFLPLLSMPPFPSFILSPSPHSCPSNYYTLKTPGTSVEWESKKSQ